MASIFAVAGMIFGMPPHVWHGTTAAQHWFRDVLVEAQQHGVSGHVVTISERRHVSVTSDNAYAVIPSPMTFKVHGKQVRQPDATFTVALRKLNEEWCIGRPGHHEQNVVNSGADDRFRPGLCPRPLSRCHA